MVENLIICGDNVLMMSRRGKEGERQRRRVEDETAVVMWGGEDGGESGGEGGGEDTGAGEEWLKKNEVAGPKRESPGALPRDHTQKDRAEGEG